MHYLHTMLRGFAPVRSLAWNNPWDQTRKLKIT